MKADYPLSSKFVLQGGRVIDGSGSLGRAADVVVDSGRLQIAAPGSIHGLDVVDVDGLTVAPGFIDVHSHADLQSILFGEDQPIHRSRLLQGVTTEVVGNCGFSPFPVPTRSADDCERLLGIVMGPGAMSFSHWSDYSDAVTAAGPASNVAPLVGHGTLRAATLGFEARAPTVSELEQMALALRESMIAGAFGLSSGLCYTPSAFAETDELRALVEVLDDVGGIYATHIRNETDLLFDSIEEAISSVRGTQVPLHISHLKAAGRPQWGAAGALLAILDGARGSGIEVTGDVYPYTAASTMLHSLLPPWLAEGGLDELIERLADPLVRLRVASELRDGVPGWQNLGQAAGWDRVTIASAGDRSEWEGHSLDDLSIEGDVDVVDTIARVLSTCDGRVVVVIEAMDDADVSEFVAWPHTMVGSDGLPLPGTPHPRLTGTFPRVLSQYRKQAGGLEMAVRRMTGASARRFGIPDRGFVRNGLVADLVVFDPEEVVDRGTYRDPWPPPIGVHHVFLAGKAVVWDGQVIDDRSGLVLRRQGS